MRKTCLNMVYELARRDERVVFVGSDLGPGVLDEMKREMPDRFFMEGVAEQNLIGMAAGLAMEGYIPYVNTIATFITRRCYEQVALDLGLQNLPVRLIGNGGGLVYAPLGPTHLAIEDLALMRAVPNMTIVAPSDAEEMRRFMHCSLDTSGPIYIRLAKGGDPVVSRAELGFEIGKGITLKELADINVIACGVMTERALSAAERLASVGHQVGVVHMHTVKPIDHDAVVAAARASKLLITWEEHLIDGGLGSAVLEVLNAEAPEKVASVRRFGLPARYPEHYGSQDELIEHYGLSADKVASKIQTYIEGAIQQMAAGLLP